MPGRREKQGIFQSLVPPEHRGVSASKPLGARPSPSEAPIYGSPSGSASVLSKNLQESGGLPFGASATGVSPAYPAAMQDTQTPLPAAGSVNIGPRVRPPETWEAVRAAYHAGESAQSVCDRFGLSLSAFRTHARREGWRRTDMPEPEPDALIDDDAPAPTREDMMETAWRMAARAIRRGRSGESQRWLAVHARLAEQARADRRTESAALAAENRGTVQRIRAIGDAARQIRRDIESAPVQTDQMHPVHPTHHDSGSSDGESPPTPLSRAERRRLEKLRRKR